MSPSNSLQVYLGGLEEADPIDLLADVSVAEALAQIVATGKVGDVKVGELFLFAEDSEDEISPETRLGREHHGKRFHAHRCRHIETTFVHVDDKPLKHGFRPAATIEKLLHWAKDNFHVDKGAKFTLRLTEKGDPLPLASHLGSYVKGPPCEITLYLVPGGKIQG